MTRFRVAEGDLNRLSAINSKIDGCVGVQVDASTQVNSASKGDAGGTLPAKRPWFNAQQHLQGIGSPRRFYGDLAPSAERGRGQHKMAIIMGGHVHTQGVVDGFYYLVNHRRARPFAIAVDVHRWPIINGQPQVACLPEIDATAQICLANEAGSCCCRAPCLTRGEAKDGLAGLISDHRPRYKAPAPRDLQRLDSQAACTASCRRIEDQVLAVVGGDAKAQSTGDRTGQFTQGHGPRVRRTCSQVNLCRRSAINGYFNKMPGHKVNISAQIGCTDNTGCRGRGPCEGSGDDAENISSGIATCRGLQDDLASRSLGWRGQCHEATVVTGYCVPQGRVDGSDDLGRPRAGRVGAGTVNRHRCSTIHL